MAKSLSLALYLAAKARRDRAARGGDPDKPLTELQKSHAAERSGAASEPRPKGPLIWFHTGQDAPATPVRDFARRLQNERDDLQILLTTSAENRPDSTPYVITQFAPDETLPAIRSFLAHWQPQISVWSEPDLRPALVAETNRHKIPLTLIDTGAARPDPQRGRWWKGMSGTILSQFQHVLAGDATSATAFHKLGATREALEIRGFLEEGTAALPCNEPDRAAIARAIGSRPVWLAAHVSESECNAVVKAHRQAQRRAHRLLLILVPELRGAGPELARALAAKGHTVALRSAGQGLDSQAQIYIADTENEMGLWYRMSPISFLGQSLEANGGVNPYEAAALGSAILHGPNVNNHAPAYARLKSANATREVQGVEALGHAVEALLSPDVAATLAHGAWQVCSTGAAVTDRVMDLILTTLDEDEAV